MSFTARKKIVKERGAEPDDFEKTVAQVREERRENAIRVPVARRRARGRGAPIGGPDYCHVPPLRA